MKKKNPKDGERKIGSGKPEKTHKAPSVRAATKHPQTKVPSVPRKPVAVVGIGASAGGLEAIKQLLQSLPATTGMAFVFVQHLEARHESMLTSILSNSTEMPIAEIKDGTPVAPNHVYVIPPNADIRLVDGVLHVFGRKAPRGRHLPIDDFFQSLAEDQGAKAIGVILSGTASDGTLGLRAIKSDGGITFAQEPETAKFDGMPANAIAAGCVDFVLPPNRIAIELAEISRHPYVGLSRTEEAVPVLSALEEEWLRVFELLKAASSVDFTYYKKPTIKRRIARRMALHKIEQLSEYVKHLESDPAELDALYQDILIHVTNFFREPGVFRAFQSRFLPRILAAKPAGEPIRIWCAGCSTGEEVYSFAICVFENLARRASAPPVMIFGSDVSEQAIEKARTGIYPAAALSQLTPERRRRFFTKVNGNYQVNANIRDVCVFARHDLTRDPPFSRLDAVSCRNVLIYLEPVLQRRVLTSFHYALKNTGVLLLGRSETLGGYTDLFSIVDRKNKFFSRKASTEIVYKMDPAAPDRVLHPRKAHAEVKSAAVYDLEKVADRLVWENYAHAGLVVDSDLQILHFRGDTSPYLRPMSGKATFHLLRMMRDELVFDLRAAIQRVRRTGTPVHRESIRIKTNENQRDVIISVFPLTGPAREKFFLVVFDEASQTAEPPAKVRKPAKAEVRETLKLKSELARTREYLQATIQDQESTNEELKTANEEALSSMEELQSSNEELETAKEELQSSNEELVTLNEQMMMRNTELSHLTDDLSNVFGSVRIPILILGDDGRIRRFTPTAEKLLNLMPGDIGRPIRNIRLGLDVPGLDDMIALVRKNGTELQQDVKAVDGNWYSVRLSPYRTRDQRINGVVIAFVDIHELKQGEEDLRTEINLTSAILDASANDLLVVVLDREGRIARFNRACQALTGYSLEEVRGKHIWDFLVPADEVPLAKAAFDEVHDGSPVRREYHWRCRDGGTKLISWSNIMSSTNGSVDYVVGTGFDVTERMESRQQVQEKEATVHALLESAAQAILAVNEEGRIVLANAAAETMFGYSREELINLTVAKLIPERLSNPRARHCANWFSPPERRRTDEAQNLIARRKDGTEFPVDVTLSQIQTRDGILDVCFVSDITDRYHHESAMLEYQKQLQSLISRLLSVQESENKIVARELHDDLSQRIAALSIEISMLPKQVEDSPEMLFERVRDLGHRIGSMAEDVHRMSRQLHPAILDDLGLAVALREECIGLSKRLGISVQFQADNVPASIASDISLCLFRVAQESLRNIGRHAEAKEVQVYLARFGTDLVLTIDDTSDGFDIEVARGKGGLGLISMEERVKLVHGDFEIHSQSGEGTRVEVRVPLERAGL